MISFKKLFYSWVVVILIVSSIPYLSAGSITLSDEGFSIRLDYLFHTIMYLILSLLFIFWKIDQPKLKMTVELIIIGISLALFDEFHQKLIPGRTFNPVDIYYNFFGIVFGLMIILFGKDHIKASCWFKKLKILLENR